MPSDEQKSSNPLSLVTEHRAERPPEPLTPALVPSQTPYLRLPIKPLPPIKEEDE